MVRNSRIPSTLVATMALLSDTNPSRLPSILYSYPWETLSQLLAQKIDEVRPRKCGSPLFLRSRLYESDSAHLEPSIPLLTYPPTSQRLVILQASAPINDFTDTKARIHQTLVALPGYGTITDAKLNGVQRMLAL